MEIIKKIMFLNIRFVYYETLVTSMKSLGVREPVISYDDLKVKSQHFMPKKKKKMYLSIAATSG